MQLETLSFCSFKSSNVSRNEYCKFMCGKGAKFRRWIASILFAIRLLKHHTSWKCQEQGQSRQLETFDTQDASWCATENAI